MVLADGSATLVRSITRRCAPFLATQVALTILFGLAMQQIDFSLGNRSVMSRSDIRQLIGEGSEGLMIGYLIVGVNLLFALGVVLFQHSDSGQLRARFPIRLYLLPMSYRRLVSIHMMVGTALVAGLLSITTASANYFFETTLSIEQVASFGMILYGSLQSWAIALAGSKRRLYAFITLAVMGALGYGLIRTPAVANTISALPPGITAVCVIVIMFVLVEAVVRIGESNRSGSFDDSGADASKEEGDRNEGAPFNSELRAQTWYEWRVVGWMLPVVSTVLMGIYFIVVPLLTAAFSSGSTVASGAGNDYAQRFAIQWSTNQQIVSTGFLTVALGAGMLTGAYMFLISGEWRQRSTFLKTRPMTTRKLARVRLFVMAKSTLISTIIFVSAFLAIGEFLKFMQPDFETLFFIRQGYEHIPKAFVLLFFAGTLFVLMWCGLWIVNFGAYLALVGTMLGASFFCGYIVFGPMGIEQVGVARWLVERGPIWATTVLWTVGCLALWLRARSAKVIPEYTAYVASVVWVVCTSAFVVYALAIRYYASYTDAEGIYHFRARVTDLSLVHENAIPFTHPVDWVLWIGLSLLPILPTVSLPYRLELMRHSS